MFVHVVHAKMYAALYAAGLALSGVQGFPGPEEKAMRLLCASRGAQEAVLARTGVAAPLRREDGAETQKSLFVCEVGDEKLRSSDLDFPGLGTR